jgi:microcystin degradation protein MlrC
MRIAVAGFMHESNTFNPIPTDRAAFAAQSLGYGRAMVDEWREAHHEVGGFLEAAQAEGFEPVPLGMAWATPSGKVTDDMFEEVTGRLIEGLAQNPCDGLLLALHGAMVADSFPDADGETVTRLRKALGPRFPVVVTLDLHGNISQRLIDGCDAALAYRTNPHVDQRDCGRRAAKILVRMIRGEIRPRQALAKPPTIMNIMVQDTSRPPLLELMNEARATEKKPGMLSMSLLPGFPYADVPQMGPSIIGVADGDEDLARTESRQLADLVWNMRARLAASLPDAATAVAQALKARSPVVLVDTGDNVGGGSAADGTVILAEMLRQQVTGGVVCLYAPEEVQQCIAAGAGQLVQLRVGGKVDRLHGDPVQVSGQVRLIHDGSYIESQVRHGGRRVNHMGLTAVVEIDGANLLVLNSLRHPPFSLGQLTCLGIQPEKQCLLVVKAAIAYKAAYTPIAGTIIEVDTPGLTAVNPERFAYRHIRRPMYPLDR